MSVNEAHCDEKREALVDVVEERIKACKDDIAKELHQMNATLSAYASAFPIIDGGPDYTGHRSYHEGLIKAAQAQERFWDELRLDVAKKGVWGLLVILIGLVMVGLSTKLGLGAGFPR